MWIKQNLKSKDSSRPKSSARDSNSPFALPSDACNGSLNLTRKFTTKSSTKSYISQPKFRNLSYGRIDHSFLSAAFNMGLATNSSKRA
ncbi:hypothetical protein BY996DRAFT_6586021 [Phakopsora pachyrhizi]|uniref:Uncharacterized protein n=1 Tax=Phakopsora pachyrhizi TaxID=170000 RepID=A0AAV0AV97_PHAPC|nr:hypothetical protein BY996DRAFT_6586021 [Phakopsora pachyrhizi]CAH7672072.1 hypothetical protein PPACK8108_LOCUS6854 [Phakopsora pachyrhizi]